MSSWQLAMLSILPLMVAGVWRKHWRDGAAAGWAVVLASSLLARLSAGDWLLGAPPLLVYVIIDGLAAAVCLKYLHNSAGLAIGVIFSAFVFLHGVAAFGRLSGDGFYQDAQVAGGWAMWAILLVWGASDARRNLGQYFSDAPSVADRGTH